jgi:hypothetical protein
MIKAALYLNQRYNEGPLYLFIRCYYNESISLYTRLILTKFLIINNIGMLPLVEPFSAVL